MSMLGDTKEFNLRSTGLSFARRERSRRSVEQTKEALAKEGVLTLPTFIKLAWHAVEPSRPYAHGWHIDAICDHLRAIDMGHINRLAIALPPGMMKSLLTAVFYPAALWGPYGMPSKRIIGFSHDTSLATRDALRCRRLLMSDWYQSIWSDSFQLLDDENMKTRYGNNQSGFRASDFVGGGTGDRGDLLIVDDPLEVKSGDSEQMLLRASRWLQETMPTRLVDPGTSAIVIIQQRVHERDPIGEVMERGLGYTLLELPMEFEVDRRCTTSIGWTDPRTEDGQLMFPERFPREVIERDRKAMSAYAWSAQMQQRPAPRGGGMFKRHWFEIVNAVPEDCDWVRRFDLASTFGAGDYTVGVLMGRSRSTKMFYVRDVVRAQLDGDGVKRLVSQTAALDVLNLGKRRYQIWLPQDPGQAGKVQAKDFINLLAGHDAHTELESGDKETRARPYAAQAEAGNVKLLHASWNEQYLDELASFPTGRHDDQIDASSGAFGTLILHAPQRIFVGAVRGLS